ncbi:hypothetical protein Tco_0950923 [Tanacetum coccineum]|uniref:Uncharacterized protein n=1 Tax=Tanacetum coccineum TaxID=301880 RepID=A0ABQ5DVF4_9ASTR
MRRGLSRLGCCVGVAPGLTALGAGPCGDTSVFNPECGGGIGRGERGWGAEGIDCRGGAGRKVRTTQPEACKLLHEHADSVGFGRILGLAKWFKNNVPSTLIEFRQESSELTQHFCYAHLSDRLMVKHEGIYSLLCDLRVCRTVEGFTFEAEYNRTPIRNAAYDSLRTRGREKVEVIGAQCAAARMDGVSCIATPRRVVGCRSADSSHSASEANATVREGGENEPGRGRRKNSKKRVVVWQKPPSYTEGEPQPMVTRELKPKVAKDVEATWKKEEKLERCYQEAKLTSEKACAGQSGWGSERILAKVKKSNKLKKKRYNQYVWTTTNRLKPEKITDTYIYPNIKPVAITVYKNNDQRNFEVYNPFKFGKLRLEPEVRIADLECNKILPKGIPFVNNKVVETPEHVIFFTDALDEHAFQRVSAIHKVEVETLLGYLVMAGNVNNLNNQRFYVLLRQMIDAHPDREKLKSKKVKLEVIRYSFN